VRDEAVTDHAPRSRADGLNVPLALRPDVEQIVALTDEFCAAHLDAEYARLCALLVAKLSRKRPSPLARGDLRIWAAAAIYAVGSIRRRNLIRVARNADRAVGMRAPQRRSTSSATAALLAR
jgi:hypothetical protein